MSQRVAFIGLGIMGAPMARNVVQAGWPLNVFARRAEARQAFAALENCRVCTSAAEAAADADIIVTMVADTPDVEQVLFAPGGVLETAKPGALLIDMSTISPTASRRFAERLAEWGIDMLDAPVSGGEVGAINATLSIMVGGSAAAFARAEPLLAVLGKNIVHIGAAGAGQVAKACNQILAAVTIEGVAEALAFAECSGVDAARVRQALLGGFAYSKALEIHGQRMLDGHYQPGFKARLHQKDMRIVQAEATKLGLALPATEAATAGIEHLVATGRGELDSSALRTLLGAGGGRAD